jgi:hypothetical protein
MIDFKFLLRYQPIVPHIVIVGVGGTGGYVTQQVSQLMSIFNIKGTLLLADFDQVEEKNLKNQLFIKKDIGKPKAEVLARRYSAAYELPISYYTASYVENITTLEKLFVRDATLPILIGCVDNNYTRQIFHQFFEQSERLVYIDVGNEAAVVPDDFRTRPKQRWTKEEIETFNETGWTGQLVVGVKWDGQVLAEPVASVFPDILTDEDTTAPSEVSCSELSASHPQKALTNRYSSMAVTTVMNELFDRWQISIHKIVFHAQRGYMRAYELN